MRDDGTYLIKRRDGEKTKVNGKTGYTANAKSMGPKGIVGLRANHNLDLRVEGFAVHQ